MIAKRKSLLMVALLVVAGCSKEAKMPEVTEENCHNHKLRTELKPESLRRKFADRCFFRNGFLDDKNPKTWTPENLFGEDK